MNYKSTKHVFDFTLKCVKTNYKNIKLNVIYLIVIDSLFKLKLFYI